MSRRRKTAANQLGDGLDARPVREEVPEIVIVDEGDPEAIHADTTSGLQEPHHVPAPRGGGDPEIIITDHEEPERREDAPSPYDVLKKQYDEREAELRMARTQRQQAEQKAAELSQTAVAHERGYKEAATAALDNAIELSSANVRQAEAAMQAAWAANDWATASKAQTIISENTARKQQLEAAKQQLESAPSQVQPYEPADPVEAQISRFSPRSQEWLREHKADIFGDPERQKDAEAAHRLVTRRGIQPDTDEYFAAIDEQMGYSSMTSTFKAATPPPPPRSHAAAPAVASAPPAKSSFGTPQSRNPNRVALTKQQREAALQIHADKPEAEALALYARGILEINQGKSNLLWSKDKYRGGPGV
jgi:hypothetical protein